MAPNDKRYCVIPLSLQEEGDTYLVGNVEMGDFYQIPEQGVKILDMLRSGKTVPAIKLQIAAEDQETVDVDEFVDQLTSIGFIHAEEDGHNIQQQLRSVARDQRRTFSVHPRVARAVFSTPMALCCSLVVLYAFLSAVVHPELRINLNAFYIENNRTSFLLLILALSFIQVALHEIGHMLAAARHGIKSKYGIGNRLWTVVAESDLTGILTLPKAQRYFPMLAGLLVDVLCMSSLTILMKLLLQYQADAFVIQVVQALVLEIAIGMVWQFNIFVKTDIYFVLCNYFGSSDLDKDARAYLRNLVHRATLGHYGRKAPEGAFKNLNVLRLFSSVWLFGRISSVVVLFGVFLPTMGQYLLSAAQLLTGPPASFGMACDTIVYVSITLTMVGTGMYMWLRQKFPGSP